MNSVQYLGILLLLAGLVAWQLMSGTAFGVWWWRPRIARSENPATYWAVLAAQGLVWIVVLLTGRSWHVR